MADNENVNAEGGEVTPNLDEVILAANDAGQKSLQAVADLLNKLADAIGDPEIDGEGEAKE